MSEWPPQPPTEQPIELSYATPSPHGSAILLVRLAFIFNLISAGFDLVCVTLAGAMVAIMYHASITAAALPPGAPAAPVPPLGLYVALYGGSGVLSLVAMGFKLWGTFRFFRRGPGAWGWGLAVGVIGCVAVWMFMSCCALSVVSIGTGIYTIVIMCLPQVRSYFQAPRETVVG